MLMFDEVLKSFPSSLVLGEWSEDGRFAIDEISEDEDEDPGPLPSAAV